MSFDGLTYMVLLLFCWLRYFFQKKDPFLANIGSFMGLALSRFFL